MFLLMIDTWRGLYTVRSMQCTASIATLGVDVVGSVDAVYGCLLGVCYGLSDAAPTTVYRGSIPLFCIDIRCWKRRWQYALLLSFCMERFRL